MSAVLPSGRARRVAIIARQRTGTHALGSILASNGFAYFDEILHVDALRLKEDRPADFIKFCLENRVSLDRYIVSPDKVFSSYVEYLDRLAEENPYVVDIKYSSSHFFLPVHWESQYTPQLFSLLGQHNFVLIHLVRNNIVEMCLSEQIARHSGRWHVYMGGPPIPEFSLSVDVEECVSYIENAALSVQRVAGWLAEYEQPVVRLAYETAFRDDALSDGAAADLEAALAVDLTSRRGVFRKPRRRLRDVIVNLDELTEALRGTPFAAMAEAVLIADMRR